MPATEDRVRTRVITSDGEMAFQEYFVKHRCEPHLLAVRYEGIEAAKPALPLVSLLEDAVGRDVDVVLGPSNPFLSLAPILDLPGMARLAERASSACDCCLADRGRAGVERPCRENNV